MARGFWKGLFHGAVISVAGLAVLSLLTPLATEKAEDNQTLPELSNPAPETTIVPADETPATREEPAQPSSESVDEQLDADSSDTSPAKPDISQSTEPDATANDSAEAPGGPRAAAVNLPVGSEFGRGGDVAPVLPAPMTSDLQSRQTDAPAVSAPTAEPAPVAITDPGIQPAADLPDTDLIRPETPQTEEAPRPDLPVIQEAPRTAGAPEMIGGEDPDKSPSIMPDDFDENTADAAPAAAEVTGQVGDSSTPPQETNEPSQSEAATPEMPSPELDLSTPPDLSDLRVMQN